MQREFFPPTGMKQNYFPYSMFYPKGEFVPGFWSLSVSSQIISTQDKKEHYQKVFIWTSDLPHTTDINVASALGEDCSPWRQQEVGICKVQRRPASSASSEKQSAACRRGLYSAVMCGDHKLKGSIDPSVAWVSKAGLSRDKSMFYCNSKVAQAHRLNEWEWNQWAALLSTKQMGPPLRIPWRKSSTSLQPNCEELCLLIVSLVAPNYSIQTMH